MRLHCSVEKFGLMERERPEDPERRARPDAGEEEFADENSSNTEEEFANENSSDAEEEPSLALCGQEDSHARQCARPA